MKPELILVETRGPVGIVTLNRPEVRNAMNEELVEDLHQTFVELDRDEITVAVRGHDVRVKRGLLDGAIVNVAPEHRDCAAAARALDVPVKEIWTSALAAAHGPAIWVGYSLGGRQALHLAVHRPEVVRGLVLISTTAGIEDDTERLRRREDDDRLAERIETIGLDAFLDEWLAGPLFAGLVDSPAVTAAR